MAVQSTKHKRNSLEDKYKLVLDTIKLYPDQLRQAWDELNAMEFPHDFQHIDKVAVCGMGGSNLGARIVDSLLVNRIRIPVEVFAEYHIPNYSDDKTLIISYSYSGNTEEAISCLNEALTRDTRIFGITTDGKLKEILESHNLPRYIIDPINNPSNQPRNAIGYAVGAILALFSKVQIAHITEDEVSGSIETMNEAIKDYDESVERHKNLAKSYAKKLARKAPILVASEHLFGVVHTIKNQFNESAKTFSALFDLPELNHHLLEGLKNPAKLREIFHFVFFNSSLYSERVQKRYPLTSEVVEKNGIEFSIFTPRSNKKMNQVFEALVFGSFVVYYLSKDYGIDPTEIPWVDYFKEKLAKV